MAAVSNTRFYISITEKPGHPAVPAQGRYRDEGWTRCGPAREDAPGLRGARCRLHWVQRAPSSPDCELVWSGGHGRRRM